MFHVTFPHFCRAVATPKNYVNEPHHGLVDESSALELDQAECVCWVGPGVLDHAPFILWGVNVHQLVRFLH